MCSVLLQPVAGCSLRFASAAAQRDHVARLTHARLLRVYFPLLQRRFRATRATTRFRATSQVTISHCGCHGWFVDGVTRALQECTAARETDTCPQDTQLLFYWPVPVPGPSINTNAAPRRPLQRHCHSTARHLPAPLTGREGAYTGNKACLVVSRHSTSQSPPPPHRIAQAATALLPEFLARADATAVVQGRRHSNVAAAVAAACVMAIQASMRRVL